MSNPGVIELVNVSSFKDSFRVEDNIGEAIHFHLNDIRLDLTTKEFLDICMKLKPILSDMITAKGFDINYFDTLFLFEIAEMLPDLMEVKIDEVYLRDLQIDSINSLGIPCLAPLYKSRVYKALCGDSKENDSRKQVNLINMTNQERLEGIVRLLKQKEYPYDKKYIVLFNEQNIIRDGQHRAAVLLYCNRNHEDIRIPVIRLIFKDLKYNIPRHQILRYIFIWTPKRVKAVIKSCIVKLFKFKNKIEVIFDFYLIKLRRKLKN